MLPSAIRSWSARPRARSRAWQSRPPACRLARIRCSRASPGRLPGCGGPARVSSPAVSSGDFVDFLEVGLQAAFGRYGGPPERLLVRGTWVAAPGLGLGPQALTSDRANQRLEADRPPCSGTSSICYSGAVPPRSGGSPWRISLSNNSFRNASSSAFSRPTARSSSAYRTVFWGFGRSAGTRSTTSS